MCNIPSPNAETTAERHGWVGVNTHSTYVVVVDAFVFRPTPEPGLKISLVRIGCLFVKRNTLTFFHMSLSIAPKLIGLFFHFRQAGVIIRKFIEMG
jgi:hypothetical protein